MLDRRGGGSSPLAGGPGRRLSRGLFLSRWFAALDRQLESGLASICRGLLALRRGSRLYCRLTAALLERRHQVDDIRAIRFDHFVGFDAFALQLRVDHRPKAGLVVVLEIG